MPLLIHPGFHKTGTTWLQKQIFSNTKYFNLLFDHREVDRIFIRDHDFDYSAEDARRSVQERLKATGGCKINVISSENLSGLIFTGSRDSRILAERLADACGPAKILFTSRAQLSITRSIYIQYVKRGGSLSIERFLDYEPDFGYFWFHETVLHFHKLVEYYARLFGSENVAVLPQELLAHDRAGYLQALMTFVSDVPEINGADLPTGKREGVSPPASGLWLMRLGNHFLPGPLNPNATSRLRPIGRALHSIARRWKIGDRKARAHLDRAIAQRLKGRFGASNRRLQAFCPVALAPLGYEMD